MSIWSRGRCQMFYYNWDCKLYKPQPALSLHTQKKPFDKKLLSGLGRRFKFIQAHEMLRFVITTPNPYKKGRVCDDNNNALWSACVENNLTCPICLIGAWLGIPPHHVIYQFSWRHQLAWPGWDSIIDPILCEKKSSLPPDAIIHQNRSGANKPLRMARTHSHVNHTCNGVNNGHKCFLSGAKLFLIPRMWTWTEHGLRHRLWMVG